MAKEEVFVDCILEGKDLRDPSEASHFDEVFKKFCNNADLRQEDTFNLYGKTDLERVHCFKKFFEWKPVPETYFRRFEKSTKISEILRDRGNKAYHCKDYEKVLRCYNLAIGFAVPGQSELGLAYEKRADLLLSLNEPDLAQRDINLAAANAFPKKAARKLIDLQNRCIEVANRKNSFLQTKDSPDKKDARRFCHEKFFKLKSPHQHIQNVEEFVEIDYRNECGRRVIVSKDVPAGTVMLMDSPYAFTLTNLLKYDTEHCNLCSLPILAGIPCSSCTFAWFCSESCIAKASNGLHKNEHKYLPYLLCHPIPTRLVTAARIFFTSNAETFFKFYSTKDPLYFSPKSGALRGYDDNGIYDVSSYLPIYHLISHPPSVFLKNISDIFSALLMTSLINQTTTFFRKPTYTAECTEENFKDFITSLFLRHMRSFEFNAITLSKLESKISADLNNNPVAAQVNDLSFMKTVRYGAAIYPVLCLLNHSCDPNSVPVRSLRHSKTCVVAIKKLYRGDEITICYTPSFINQECEERLMYLYDRYSFWCTCDACNHKWSPTSRTNNFGESNCDKCHRYLLTGQCPGCTLRDRKMPLLIEELTTNAKKADELMESGKFKDAEKLLTECLRKCEGFSSCFGLHIDLQTLYKRALVGLFNQ